MLALSKERDFTIEQGRKELPHAVFSTDCTDCPRLAGFLQGIRREYPGYHSKPVAPFGDAHPRLFIVGLAPGLHGANRTGRPFTGDHAGILLYQTLHRFGFATLPQSKSLDDKLRLTGCRITNAVKCVPPANKPMPKEIAICNKYLKHEIKVLKEGAAILALGRIAHQAVLMALRLKMKDYPFAHGVRYKLDTGLTLYDSYHCSRYNTQTRRLTEAMFNQIFKDILENSLKTSTNPS
ncbi:MAG: uracil-DNA glycosylase [Burkholderiales bacterium]